MPHSYSGADQQYVMFSKTSGVSIVRQRAPRSNDDDDVITYCTWYIRRQVCLCGLSRHQTDPEYVSIKIQTYEYQVPLEIRSCDKREYCTRYLINPNGLVRLDLTVEQIILLHGLNDQLPDHASISHLVVVSCCATAAAAGVVSTHGAEVTNAHNRGRRSTRGACGVNIVRITCLCQLTSRKKTCPGSSRHDESSAQQGADHIAQ